MDPSPSKRALTRAALSATNEPRNDYGIDPDLRLQLQNRASRVRKSVTEGYATHRSLMEPQPAPVGAASIFRSAKDINRHVFASGTISPFSSPKKRNRSQYEDHVGHSPKDDVDVEMHDATLVSSCQVNAEQFSVRRIKPLRQTKCPITVAKYKTDPPHLAQNLPMPEVKSVDPKNDPFLL